MSTKVLKVFDLTRRATISLTKEQTSSIEEDAEQGCQLIANQFNKTILLTIRSQVCKHVQKTSLAAVFYPHDSPEDKGLTDIQINVLSDKKLTGSPDQKCTLCLLRKNMMRK